MCVGVCTLPEWGLTRDQINAEPWGLARELLQPHKKLTDPVHGDVHLTVLETAVLDSAPLQRLRRVRQLGTTHLVYPGATHTRFSHSLGALRAAQNLMDAALAQGLGPHAADDLFSEWRSTANAEIYNKRVAEATVLARLGALVHDLCHIPFGHTLEDDLGILDSHDENHRRYDSLWPDVLSDLRTRSDLVQGGITLPDELAEQLKRLILSKSDQARSIAQQYPFVEDIVGNTICADLIDYLQRDHYYTGLPAGFGHRFFDGFYVTRSDHPNQPARMVIRISRAGQVRADVVSELLKFLRYRYELSERVLVHHAKLAADVMIGKAMEMWRDALQSESSDEAAITTIEEQVLRRSDDGLLEYLEDEAERYQGDRRWHGIGEIAKQIQSRRLFRSAGRYSRRAMADELYERYGSRSARAELEQDGAEYAGIEDDWMIALWVPKPTMRLKPAAVLVDDGAPTEIVPLEAWDLENGLRGSEIIESHRGLWAIHVYVDRRLPKPQRDVVLARLQMRLGINGWDDSDRSLAQMAAERVRAERRWPAARLTELTQSAERELSDQPTFDGLVQAVRDGSRPRDDLGVLDTWRTRGGISIEHPDLEAAIAGAPDSVVRVDEMEFDVATEEGVVRLNLTLFVRELGDEAFVTPDGRERVRALIDEAPDDFEKRVSNQLSAGNVAQRAGDAEDGTNEPVLAVELAVREFVSAASTLGLDL